jgi:hypothetical protein
MFRNTMRRLRAALRNSLRGLLGYDIELQSMQRSMDTLRRQQGDLDHLVRERIDIAVDVGGPREMSSVIVVGRYRGVDYVQSFHMPERELGHLVDRLRDMERHGVTRRMDSPPQFRAVVKRERSW